MVTITQLTPGAAQQALQDDGAAALGLTAPLLSPIWSSETPNLNGDPPLTLSFDTPVQMPFLGILETVDVPRDVFELDGSPVVGPATVIRLHPQAAARLETIAAGRYAATPANFHHPVATQLVIRATAGGEPLAPQWWEPGDITGIIGDASLHDRRGLIIDPVAAAAMYADLVAAFPALLTLSSDLPDQDLDVESPGGLAPIAELETGTLVHVVDPHGALFAPVVTGRTITRRSGDTVMGTLDGGGLIDLPPGESLRASEDDDAAAADADDPVGARLRWGWSVGGQLARTPLAVPALPGTGSPAPALARQFLRLTVVDLPWHILGNRGTAEQAGIPGDDGDVPAAFQPRLRADLPVDYLSDGTAVLAAAGQVVARFISAGGGMILAASPTLDAAVGLPPAADASGRWPQVPGTDTGLGFPPGAPSPATGLTAAWVSNEVDDVVVTIVDGQVPNGAHVRIFPQQFAEIDAIAEAPSFLRGDGGAGIATGGDLLILLPNPLRLLDGEERPSSPRLTLDIVVAPRLGERRLFANVSVPIADGPAPAPPDPFFVAPDPLDEIPMWFRSIAPVPLFGMERGAGPGGSPGSPAELARALASETEPREGPRLPTQGRFESLVVSGIPNGGEELSWQAVVTGGRWARETRSSRHRDGNPGNPAGPDVHAAGVRVGGDLALDVARLGARRVQPMIPLTTSPVTSPGWIWAMGGNNFNDPSVLAPGESEGANAGAGAALKTIAAVCETPELSLTNFDLPEDEVVFQDILADAASALGLPPPAITIENEDRLANEIVKEFYHSRHGSRDALWALRRALGAARELVYIESPQFARTAAAAADPFELVQVLADRLGAQQGLRVVLCLPREGDFDPRYRGFVRQSVAARQQALELLQLAGGERVVAFHPKGFPGRHAQVRSTVVIVDDCWSLVGSSHFRRRGMTFDGGADIASIPYGLRHGYAGPLARFRQELMARKLGLEPTRQADRATADWARLADPASSVQVFSTLLAQDGAGMIEPIWPGPSDNAVDAANDEVADPDGTDGADFITHLAGFLNEINGDAEA